MCSLIFCWYIKIYDIEIGKVGLVFKLKKENLEIINDWVKNIDNKITIRKR